MKKLDAITLLFLFAGGLASCQLPTALQDSEPWPFTGEERHADWQRDGRFRQELDPAAPLEEASASVAAQEPAPAPPLYSWDGGVVESARQGAVAESSPGHGIQPTAEGRMHIIELYQGVLDERDSLIREVQMLGTTLDKTQELLERSLRDRSELEVQIADLEGAHELMKGENQQLVSRLTTAQIRRLESEKLLLQSQIAWHRQNQASPALEPQGSAPPVGTDGGQ